MNSDTAIRMARELLMQNCDEGTFVVDLTSDSGASVKDALEKLGATVNQDRNRLIVRCPQT